MSIGVPDRGLSGSFLEDVSLAVSYVLVITALTDGLCVSILSMVSSTSSMGVVVPFFICNARAHHSNSILREDKIIDLRAISY